MEKKTVAIAKSTARVLHDVVQKVRNPTLHPGGPRIEKWGVIPGQGLPFQNVGTVEIPPFVPVTCWVTDAGGLLAAFPALTEGDSIETFNFQSSLPYWGGQAEIDWLCPDGIYINGREPVLPNAFGLCHDAGGQPRLARIVMNAFAPRVGDYCGAWGKGADSDLRRTLLWGGLGGFRVMGYFGFTVPNASTPYQFGWVEADRKGPWWCKAVSPSVPGQQGSAEDQYATNENYVMVNPCMDARGARAIHEDVNVKVYLPGGGTAEQGDIFLYTPIQGSLGGPTVAMARVGLTGGWIMGTLNADLEAGHTATINVEGADANAEAKTVYGYLVPTGYTIPEGRKVIAFSGSNAHPMVGCWEPTEVVVIEDVDVDATERTFNRKPRTITVPCLDDAVDFVVYHSGTECGS